MDEIILRNLFRNVNTDVLSTSEKVLAFYKFAIELERIKEPDIYDYYEYPINYHRNERIMLVDFPCNETFLEKFERNRNRQETKFPSDLYIGLKIQTGDVAYRLLNMVIDYNDIKTIFIEEELLPIRIADFEVNLKEASRLELLPEKIESINAGIKDNPTWKGILTVLRNEISEDVTISDSLFLALSSKSIELSQIYSELNNKHLQSALTPRVIVPSALSRQKEVQRQHTLLESFLLNESIDNAIDSVDIDTLLCVTKLDESQKRAVADAMNSRVSVITGAPGTGKTQVIENLLVNALIQGKKVLVASKNNKAVDNVKDRFDEIDKTGYFLRFGARQVVSTSTLPAIERILVEIGRLQDNANDFNSCREQYALSIKNIQQGKKDIERIQQLQYEIASLSQKIADCQAALQQLAPEHESKVTGIEGRNSHYLPLKDCSVDELNRCLSGIKIMENNYNAKFTGFFGFWHRAFSVKKSAVHLLNEIERFPLALKNCSSNTKFELCSETNDFKDYTILITQIKKWRDLIKKGMSFKDELTNEQNRYLKAKSNAERTLNQLNSEKQKRENDLDVLNNAMPSINAKMDETKKWIKNNGLKMLSAYIHHYKLTENSIRMTNGYKNYLPDQIPWKDEEYNLFINKTKDFLNIFRLCSVTSLSTKNAFPLTSELFDMVIVDEASQCDIASAIPLIMRTKQLVVIGDPMQLRHISAVKVEEEQEIKQKLGLANSQYVRYAEYSLYDYCKDYISNVNNGQSTPYMLRYHYRCYSPIIGYSNDMFYGGMMGARLEVRTDTRMLKGNPQGIVLVDVKGKQVNENVNVNEAEAKKSIELAVQVAKSYPDVTIGIVTPFRHQAERINSLIPDSFADRIEANTVHKYQGDEKDIMIYSLVVTSNSPDRKIYWIDNIVPNLVNVAVTRAKSTLYVVGNIDYIKAHSSANKPLGNLVRYSN